MSLFQQASLIIKPNGRKSGKIYALKPFNGRGDLTVVRATTATEVNSSGVIVDVASNVARFDYTNGSCPSILVEPQRTNLVFPSATATTQSRTVTAVAHTLSFYGTGSITLSGVATGTLVGTGVSNRVTLTFTPTAGSLTLTVTGSVTNWQLEAGANATSYIPTVASAVTRNADVISKTGISDLIGQTEGTMYVDCNINTIEALNRRVLSISDGTTTNRINIGFVGTTLSLTFLARNSGGFIVNTNNLVDYGSIKICFKYSSIGYKLFVNGSLFNDSSFGLIPNLNVLEIGSFRNGDFLNDGINLVALYKAQLTDAECINLTSI